MIRPSLRTWLLAPALILAAALIWWLAPEPDAPEQPSARTPIAEREEPEAAPESAATPSSRLTMTATEVEHEASADDAVLSGRVVDADTRAPVAGAQLTFTSGLTWPGPAHDVMANAKGEFRWVVQEPGDYRLITASAPGYAPYLGTDSGNMLTFSAHRGVRVTGAEVALIKLRTYDVQVATHEGTPLPRSEVEVLDVDPSMMSETLSFTTGAQGKVLVQAGELPLVEARHPGYVPQRARLREGQLNLLQLKPGEAPTPKGVLAGVVVDPKGEPVVEAEVTALLLTRGPPQESLHARQRLATDGAGRFRFERLPAGKYWIEAAQSPWASTSLTARTDHTKLRLQLSTPATLEGRVTTPGGEPVPSFSIVVLNEQTRSFFEQDGRYRIEGLAPGKKWIGALAFGYGPTPERQIELRAGETLQQDFQLEGGGAVFGQVVQADGGAPVPGAVVGLEGLYGADQGATPVRSTTVTGIDGSFELEGVGSGLRTLEVQAPGFHHRLVSALSVTAGQRLGPIRVELTAVQAGERRQTELTGIGATLTRHDDGSLEIQQTLGGGGAAEAGLAKGDVILSIDGQPTANFNMRDAVEHIRGEAGTTVRLEVRRQDGTIDTVLVDRRIVRAGG